MDKHTKDLLRSAGGDALVKEVERFSDRIAKRVRRYQDSLGKAEWECEYCGERNAGVSRCEGCQAPQPSPSIFEKPKPVLPIHGDIHGERNYYMEWNVPE